jgi:hypothetical protein
MISQATLDKVESYYKEHGFHQTMKHLHISRKSLQRYLQLMRKNQQAHAKPDGPKILLFDIETSLMKFWSFRPGKQYLGHRNIIDDWFMIGWSAKWLHETEFMSSILSPEEILAKDDSRLAKEMWKKFDEADIVIAHNAHGFDVPKLNSRYLMNGIMIPPSSYQVIDTLKEFRRHFGMSSNAQDFLTRMLKLPQKLETNFDLWVRCMAGEQEALKEMNIYNIHDVGGLEELYMTVRPWMKSHPNVSLYYDEIDVTRCPKCGSTELYWKDDYRTPAGRFNQFRCECGTIGRSRYSNLTAEERTFITVSTAR